MTCTRSDEPARGSHEMGGPGPNDDDDEDKDEYEDEEEGGDSEGDA